MGSKAGRGALVSQNISYVVILLIWTGFLLGSYFFNKNRLDDDILRLASTKAESLWEKDILYRRWNSSHGGVYVPVTEATQPNPDLDVPYRDITTDNGKELTLINPAFMTRQVYEIANEKYGITGHMISLNPLRKQNVPDAWERQGLQAFERGVMEVSAVDTLNGKRYLRLLKPFVTEESCMHCHAKQGYKVGDIRGGISVAVPLGDFQEAQRSQLLGMTWAHLLIWLFGTALSAIGYVSSRKKTIALAESGEKFRQLYEGIHDIVLVLRYTDYHKNLVVTDANDAAEAALNRTKSGLLGQGTEEFLSSLIVYRILTVDRTETPVETSFRRLDGSELHVELTWRNLAIGGETVVLLIARDISGRKEAEHEINGYLYQLKNSNDELEEKSRRLTEINRQLQESEQRLKELNATKDKFFRIISHDLRGPFSNITNLAKHLAQQFDELPQDKQKRYATLIQASSEGAYALLSNLLQWAKLQTSGLKPSFQAVRFSYLIPRAMQLFAVEAEEKAIDFHINVDDTVTVTADYDMLFSTVRNLISNAVKFTPQGGDITISSHITDTGVLLEVSDTGVGMTGDEIAKLFRIDSGFRKRGTANEEGNGLGLLLCKEFVEAHGGSVSVRSQPDQGTTFTVTLPAN